jgi:uncharacterized protein
LKLADRYRRPADLPARIPVFPLRGVILLPRTSLPLNIFEPRYLQMLDDVMSGTRVLGIVQPGQSTQGESPLAPSAGLRSTGAVGRLTAYQELDDGRLVISLTGICRFKIAEEIAVPTPYRSFHVDYEPFAGDFGSDETENAVDRDKLLETLKAYLSARSLRADWESIGQASNEALVNGLSMMSPYAPEEKQALLEAADLKTRAEILVALAQMELAAGTGGTGSTLQ